MTTTKDLAEALRELIALKDLKEGAMERSIKASMSKGANPSERYHEWNADYMRRNPLAWEACRAALASHDAAQSAVAAPPSPAVERDERAEFEAWAGSMFRYMNPGPLERNRISSSLYFYGTVDAAWSAWRARAALEGEKP